MRRPRTTRMVSPEGGVPSLSIAAYKSPLDVTRVFYKESNMPYITQQERDRLDPLLQPLLYQLGTADRGVFGRLNYVITRLIAYAWRVESSYVRAAALSGVLTN